jgi:ABC-type antimicrobial peptide transport system permease subunit
MAEWMYPKVDPIGRCFYLPPAGTDCLTVVGTVADAHWHHLFEPPAFSFYQPLTPGDTDLFQILSIRVRSDGERAIPVIRAAMLAAMPDAHAMEVVTLQDHLNPELRPWRLGATLFLVFGALALVVAAIGLYSVMACRVEQRRHEMGVRSALGAEWGDLIRLVMGEGVLLVAGGVLLGLLVALAAAPAIAPLLYQTSPRDPTVMAVVAVVLLLAAAVACAVPAIRASRVDPLEALKAE